MQQRTQEDIIESGISLFHGDQTQVYKDVTENVHLLTESHRHRRASSRTSFSSLSRSDIKGYILDRKPLTLKIPEI